MPSINLDDYLESKGQTIEQLENDITVQYFPDMLDRFQDAVPETGITSSASPFAELLKEIEDQSAGGANEVKINGFAIDFESFGQSGNFKAADFSIDGIEDVMFLHFTRNILIDYSMTYEYVIENPHLYKKVADAKNAFHKYDYTQNDQSIVGNEDNVKWVSLDGKEEYIFREVENVGWELVVDPINQGSYNFYGPDEFWNHKHFDVDPWGFFGNFFGDPTTQEDRKIGLDDLEIQPIVTIEKAVYDDGTNLLFVAEPSELEGYTYKFYGGDGDDVIVSAPFADVVHGGTGTDAVAYWDSKSGVTLNLEVGFAFDGYGSRPDEGINLPFDAKYEKLIGVENVFGSNHNDIIIGDGKNNRLDGRNGADYINGGDGNDTLNGQNGDDRLKGGADDDTLNGGAGYDIAVYDGNISDYTVTQDSSNLGTWIVTGIDGTDTLVGIEAIQYANGKENLSAQNVEDTEFGQKLVTSNAQAAIDYLFAENSGLSISAINYTGSLDALRLLPSSNTISNSAGAAITIGSGVFLTTGGMPGTQNTESGYTVNLGTPGDTDLDATAQLAFSNSGTTNDAAVIEFTFTLAEGVNASTISFEVAFGSEEYPEYVDSSYVDIAAVYVNGVNYALFNGEDDQPLSVVQKNIDAANLIDNTSGQYGIEYDGFSPVLKITAPIQAGENTVKIGIADTGDSALDSGLFIGNIQVGNSSGSGTFVPVLGTATDDNTVGDDSPEEFILGLGNDKVNPGGGFDVMTLGGGADIVEGTPDDLNGDIVTDFTNEDKLVYTGVSFTKDQMTITMGSAIIDVDIDGDGVSDTTTKLEGDFEFVEFNVENVDGNTILTTSYINQELFGTNGDDNLSGNVGNDVLVSGLGNNTLSGQGGNDKIVSLSGIGNLSGGSGGDFIVAGISADMIDAGHGNDIVRGDASKFLGGSDEIFGNGGDDILMGGRGADTFVFATGDGADTIAAFESSDVIFDAVTGYRVSTLSQDFQSGVDHIQLTGFSTVDASNVMDFVSDSADGARFSAEGTDILFYGIAASQISADDFLFTVI